MKGNISLVKSTTSNGITDLSAKGIFTPASLKELIATEQKSQYLVEGLVRTKTLNILIGDSNLGKTPMAIQLGICIASGLAFLGRKVQQGPVLYCDAENDPMQFDETLNAITSHLGLAEAPESFQIWSPNWETANSADANFPWFTRMLDKVHHVKPSLVVIDSLRMFMPEAESKSDEATKLFKQLRTSAKNTSWLLLHHRRKLNQLGYTPHLEENPQGWMQEAAGAHAIVNQSDTRLGMVPASGTADVLLGGLIRGKAPFAPIKVARAWNEDSEPVGYKALAGIECLNIDDQQTYKQLGSFFRHKDVAAAMGNTSGSNVSRFIRACIDARIAQKGGRRVPEGRSDGVDGALGVRLRRLHGVHHDDACVGTLARCELGWRLHLRTQPRLSNSARVQR